MTQNPKFNLAEIIQLVFKIVQTIINLINDETKKV